MWDLRFRDPIYPDHAWPAGIGRRPLRLLVFAVAETLGQRTPAVVWVRSGITARFLASSAFQ